MKFWIKKEMSASCSKCFGIFTGYFCDYHQKEYDKWLNANYVDLPCECGFNQWKDGQLKINIAGSTQDVYRCVNCNKVQLEECISKGVEQFEKWIRIKHRNE
jgi:hypothetical protein